MRGPLAASMGFLGLVACVPTNELPPIPTEDYLKVFIVAAPDSNPELAEVRGELRSGSPRVLPAAVLADATIYAVGLRRDALVSLHPDLALDDVDAIGLQDAPSAEIFDDRCTELGVLDERGHLTWPLGEHGEVLQVNNRSWTRVATPHALTRLGLELPTHPCAETRFTVRPFGARSPYLEPGATVRGQTIISNELESTVLIEGNELFALVDDAILRIEKNGTHVDGERHFSIQALPPPPLPNARWQLEEFARVPTSETRPIEGLLLAASITVPDDEDQGIGIFRVDIDAEGRFGPVQTKLIFQADKTSIDALAMGENGAYAATAGGRVITATATDAIPELRTDAESGVESLAYDSEARPPMLFGTREGRILAGDLFDERGLTVEVNGDGLFARVLTFVHGVPHAGVDLPPMLKRGSAGWERLPFPLPASLPGCAAKERVCGRTMPGTERIDAIGSLEDERGRFAVAWAGCLGFAVVEPRPVEACVTGLHIPAYELSETDKADLDDIRIWNGHAILVGDGALLIEVSIED